jgi:hypothetical protein
MQADLFSDRIRRRARRLQIALFVATLVTVVGAGLIAWNDFGHLLGKPSSGPLTIGFQAAKTWSTWTVQIAMSISTVIALLHLMWLLGRWTSDDVFSRASGADLRGFARWMCIGFVCQLVIPLLFLLVIRVNGTGRPGSIGFSGSDVLLLVASAVLYEAAGILDLAYGLSSEYRQIV